ncbi:MAG: hypothetical protein JW702_00360 [Clostridiales bacterium]|nr:hypothetical protein [Clostridiales bacterium]
MNRLTHYSEETKSFSSNNSIDEIIEVLAKYENLLDHLLLRQQQIPMELEKLREQGKEKSYKFRELFGEKLTVEAFLALMKTHKII